MITIVPLTYELFPFVDPFDDPGNIVATSLPILISSSGICYNRSARRNAGTCWDGSPGLVFIHPSGVALPVILRAARVGCCRSSVISPIVHVPSTESSDIPTTDSMASVSADCDDRLLASLLPRSSFQSMSHDPMTSESTFYSAMDSLARPTLAGCSVPTPGWRLKQEALMPHPRIGDPSGGCAFRCTTYRNSDFA